MFNVKCESVLFEIQKTLSNYSLDRVLYGNVKLMPII